MGIGLLEILLVLNALWFAGGFHLFYLRREVFAKVLVPNKEDRNSPAYDTLIETGRFLGGFNLAFAVLNIFLLFNFAEFDKDIQWAVFLIVISIAHGTQFVGNIPMALRNRRGEGIWNVFEGIMLCIFVIDFTLMTLNAALAIAYIL